MGQVVPLRGSDGARTWAQRLSEGQPAARAWFVQQFSHHVASLVYSTLGSRTDHDDLVQQVFLELLGSLSTVRDGERLKGWVSQVTVNTCRTLLRRERRGRWLRLFSSSEEAPEAWADDRLDARQVALLKATYSVLEGLDADERIAFSLHYLEELSIDETATAMGLSTATVKRRLSAAREHFREAAQSVPLLMEVLEAADER